MEITILAIDLTKTVPAPGSRSEGYRGKFSLGKLTGSAVLVPFLGDPSRLQLGAKIAIETNYSTLENWANEDASGPTFLEPLEVLGNFRVCGDLLIVGKNTAAIVEAGGLVFHIPTRELPTPIPSDGSRVQFDLIGLSLWDDGDQDLI